VTAIEPHEVGGAVRSPMPRPLARVPEGSIMGASASKHHQLQPSIRRPASFEDESHIWFRRRDSGLDGSWAVYV